MPIYTPSRSPCPVGRASRILGDRWALLILREALHGEQRFDGWMKRLSISRAVLTDRLEMLTSAQLLERDPPEGKRAVYKLTEKGLALQPIFTQITKWGEEHLPYHGTAKAENWRD